MDGKAIIAFVIGAAAGAVGSYLYLKPKYEEDKANNAEMNKRYYDEKLKEFYDLHPEQCITEEPKEEEPAVDIPEEKRKADELAAKLNYNALYNKEPLGQTAKEDPPYLISPEQYDSETLLDRRNLTYYEGDDVLCDELTEEVLDIENVVGIENIQSFGNDFEEDPYIMHIRNNTFGCVYEICKDERSYSAVVGDIE